jgi:hypothetical protein
VRTILRRSCPIEPGEEPEKRRAASYTTDRHPDQHLIKRLLIKNLTANLRGIGDILRECWFLSLSFSLKARQTQAIPRQRLSEGDKQIFSIAMLCGLA